MNTPFDPEPPRRRPGLLATFRASFLTGLVVIAPVGLTVWLIWSVVGWVDGFVLPLVPLQYQPDKLIQTYLGLDPAVQINVRGIGLIIFLFFTIFVGWLAKGYIGRSFIRWAEGIVERTPVVRSIYNGIKQISETVFAQTESSFEKACLIEYPRKGIWAIGFISTQARGEIAERAGQYGDLLSIFVPTTPNPTSGFLLFLPAEDVIELDMSVEDTAKLVISAGLVYPNGKDAKDALEEMAKEAAE
ncbi:MAG: DUF502 domain-containing protein [Paracoccaceae bacterium]